MVGLEIAEIMAPVLCNGRVYNFFFKWGIDDSLLHELEAQFHGMKDILAAAEVRLIDSETNVRKWLSDARCAFHDAKDLLDRIFTDFKTEKYKLGDSPRTIDKAIHKVNHKRIDMFRAIHPSKKAREVEMREIIHRLQSLAAQGPQLDLRDTNDLITFRTKRVSTSSGNDQSKIIGRSENVKEVLQILNSREGDDDALRVLPVIGMGGVGKTTLASSVYSEYQSSEHEVFQVKAWVHVSDQFRITAVIKSLLEVIQGKPNSSDNLEFLQNELKSTLQNKRFLLILDDTWPDDQVQNEWETLKTIFSVGAPGSRIVVTTRERNVTQFLSTSGTSPYILNELTYDESWSLFQSYAFENGNSSAYPNLEVIRRRIVEKCKGLPLAIKMLGRLLYSKENDVNEWKSVLDSEIWKSTNTILPSLWLSYYHLPLPVRHCFGYLSLFRKDAHFSMEETVMLWIAEGFVKEPHGSTYEHEARKYFKHLCSSFFLQPISFGGHLSNLFAMHDLVHDLAKYVFEDYIVDLAAKNFKSYRLPYLHDQRSLLDPRLKKFKRLRTLLSQNSGKKSAHLFKNNKVCNDLLSNFKSLRVLSLKEFAISVLPDSIADMKLLRYLNVSWTKIEYLPQWIRSLYNLQVLDVSYCSKLKSFPAGLCELVNLRHLFTDLGDDMPNGFGKMTSLQTLGKFTLHEGQSKKMKEFKELNSLRGGLRGGLHIFGLKYVDDLQDVKTANFRIKEYLEKLAFHWDVKSGFDLYERVLDFDRDTDLDERVLDALQSHENLKELTIDGYGGRRLSKWIVEPSPSFNGLTSLEISNCFNCDSLPSLGNLPYLQTLCIKKLHRLESIGEEFYGDVDDPFPTLEILRIEGLKALRKWCFLDSGRRGISSLNDLTISGCPELYEIPYCFPHLITLTIRDCINLFRLELCNEDEGSVSTTYGDSLKNIRIEYCPKLKEIPRSFGNLATVEIVNCHSLVSVPRMLHVRELNFRSAGSSLYIDSIIQDCSDEALEKLKVQEQGSFSKFSSSFATLNRFTSLKDLNLYINDDDDDDINGSEDDSDSMIGLPPNLKKFTVWGGINGKSLMAISSLNSLTQMDITGCHALESFPNVELPFTLERFTIGYCEALKSIPDSCLCPRHKSLYYLKIEHCPSLTDLPCGLLNLQSLQNLTIRWCPLIRNFPKSSSPHYLTSLEELKLESLEELNSLPNGFHNTISLEKLLITDCPNVVIPHDGFPTELRSLSIIGCRKLTPIPAMKLVNLKSLRDLILEGFPEVYTLDNCLPESVKKLTLTEFPKLKSMKLGNLNSIVNLSLKGFPEVYTLDNCLPESVEKLTLTEFPKLKSLSGVLPSLKRLTYLFVKGCPHVTRKSCSKKLKPTVTVNIY